MPAYVAHSAASSPTAAPGASRTAGASTAAGTNRTKRASRIKSARRTKRISTAKRTSNADPRARGGVHFPATLFGLPHNTSRGARQLTHVFDHTFSTIPLFTHPRAALYGTSSNRPFFIVSISGLSAAARKYGGKASAAALRRGLLIMGSADAQRFSAGRGVKQACGHLTRNATTVVLCLQYGKKVGVTVYFNGAAASLSDAAAKTYQAISASGG